MSLTVVNPATEMPIAELEQAGVEEADKAVAHAKATFPAWSAVAPAEPRRAVVGPDLLAERAAQGSAPGRAEPFR